VNTVHRLRLKRAAGWFAAGREIESAAMLLSDGAFKVFVWACLHAERTSGTLNVSLADMALALGKDRADIQSGMQELIQAGVCRWHEYGTFEIQDRFWPYQRIRSGTQCSETYVAAIRTMLQRHACVRCAFTHADETLAAEWHRRGVAIETAERAITLGVLRKYVTLLNRGSGPLITTLHYFAQLVDEVDQLGVSLNYWAYASGKLADLERRWMARPGAVAAQTETK